MGPLTFNFNPGMAKEFETPLMIKHRLKSGRWTQSEHAIFVDGLKKYGKDWKEISKLLSTRTSIQIRTHAQKYFLKYPEEAKRFNSTKSKRSEQPPESPKRRLATSAAAKPEDADVARPSKLPRMKKTQSSPDVLRIPVRRKPFLGTQPWLDSDSEAEELTTRFARSVQATNILSAERRKSTSALLDEKNLSYRIDQAFQPVDHMNSCRESLMIDNNIPNFFGPDLDMVCIPEHVQEDFNKFKLDEDFDLTSW